MSNEKFYKVSIFALPLIHSAILRDRIKLDEYIPEDIKDEMIAETRNQILQKLNNAKGVSDIREVLSKEEKEKHAVWVHTYHAERFRRKPLEDYEKYPIFSFEPIMFSYKMPIGLQESLFPAEYPNEDFRIVWDGVIILIAGTSPINKVPSGISDVAEKISSIVSEPRKMICMRVGLGLRKDIVFVPDLGIKGPRKWDFLIDFGDPNDIDSNLKTLYLTLYSFANRLYDLRVHWDELWDFARELNEIQENIFKKINKYIRLSSWNVLAKNTLINDIEKMLVKAFTRYTEFTRSKDIYTRSKHNALQGPLAWKEFVEVFRDDLVETYESPSFNEQMFHWTLDKVQGIFERFSLNRSNVIAGALGGAIVFVLTQVINYLIPVLNTLRN